MLWEIEIRPLGPDGEQQRICEEFDLLTHAHRGPGLIAGTARGFLLEGDLSEAAVRSFELELLVDPLVETSTLTRLDTEDPLAPREEYSARSACGSLALGCHRQTSSEDPHAERAEYTEDPLAEREEYTVLRKPGVMDPVSQSVLEAAAGLGYPLEGVRTFRRYFAGPALTPADLDVLLRKVLSNDAIEQVVRGPLHVGHLTLQGEYAFHLLTVPLCDLDGAALEKVSKEGGLALNLEEMRTIQAHFREQQRDPTDIELETIAQTWSEHCSHKTLKGPIDVIETIDGKKQTRQIGNLLKETIFASTQEIRRRLGDDDWCVSVFADNAGIVAFDDSHYVCIKVETHNRPSALEPYGGANTGLGGVIRDVLGTGLGALPICNTDVFCFARPDYPPEELPPGVLHPRRVMQGVVAGVRDYGNRMGIPTVSGAIIFDDRYLANPLVFCGTVGLMPHNAAFKEVQPGDFIVALGGRTGRDGIHGATFSSEGLTAESEQVSGGAVQIGNAIEEKKLLDVLLQARDRGLYDAVTDCGAGGFSSAVGEMGAELGAVVELDLAPLKYEGLTYTQIWISESQERMVLAVPPEKWHELEALCRGEGVEAANLGFFEATGRLRLNFRGTQVADLDMHFLHEGRPAVVRSAEVIHLPLTSSRQQEVGSCRVGVGFAEPTSSRQQEVGSAKPEPTLQEVVPQKALMAILGSLSVCSKEWVIRQYDHEVQGGSVVKPLVGVANDGPSDAAVILPVLNSFSGLAVGCGINPLYADLDPYAMAAAAIDEAVRNVVAVGADPARIAILDNFCWGNITDPAVLGSLVRAAEACRDVALAFGTPFISGKDSLNNEYRSADKRISIPGTLLITSLGRVADVRRCVTMDLKEAGNFLFLIGTTHDEMGGSHYHLITGHTGGGVPRVDLAMAPRIFRAVHGAIERGLLRACHDLSEGGFAVALAEMAFAGHVGADITGLRNPTGAEGEPDSVCLFSESTTRFVVEVRPGDVEAFREAMKGIPITLLGKTVKEPRLRLAGRDGEWLIWASLAELKEAWQEPLQAL